MGSEQIVRYGSRVLAEPTQEVPELTDEIRELISRMYVIMHESNGVGLAANQIGVPLRLFTYDIGEGPHAIINGKISKKQGKQKEIEGCLSIPGLQGEVERANTVTITGIDENGEKVKLTGEGLLARVFQHETDHLDGTLFIDRADPHSLEWVMPSRGDDEEEEEDDQ
jgi:peptide deformylase